MKKKTKIRKREQPKSKEGVTVTNRSELLERAMESFPTEQAHERFGGADNYSVDVRDDGHTRITVKSSEMEWRDAIPGEIRAIDDDENSVELSFSSETPVPDYFGVNEILSHETSDCDFSRLREVGSILKNHNASMIVGGPSNVRLDKTEKKGRLKATFGTTAVALDTKKEVMIDKTLKGVSVGYKVLEWVYLKDEETKYKRFVGPAWIASKWEALEASFTPIPADSSVGVGRNTSTKEDEEMTKAEKEAKEKKEREEKEAREKKEKEEREAKEKADREKKEKEEREAEAERKRKEEEGKSEETREAEKRGREAEAKRQEEIRNMCKASNIEQKDADEMLKDSSITAADARKRVLEI